MTNGETEGMFNNQKFSICSVWHVILQVSKITPAFPSFHKARLVFVKAHKIVDDILHAKSKIVFQVSWQENHFLYLWAKDLSKYW